MMKSKDSNRTQQPEATEGSVEVKPRFTETAQVRSLPAAPTTNLRLFQRFVCISACFVFSPLVL
jgi:hypothetical protein